MSDIGKNNCSNSAINLLIKLDNNPSNSIDFCKNPLYSKENMGMHAILNLHHGYQAVVRLVEKDDI